MRRRPGPEPRPQRRDRVVGHEPLPDQFPQRLCHRRLGRHRRRRRERPEEVGPAVGQRLEERLLQLPLRAHPGRPELGQVRRVERHPPVMARQRAVAAPHDLAGRAQLVEHPGGVVTHPRRQNQGFHRGRRQHRPGQLLDRPQDALGPAQPPLGTLPGGQESPVVGLWNRLHLGSQRRDRAAPDRPQHARVTELARGGVRTELALDHPPVRGEATQRVRRDRAPEPKPRGGFLNGERHVRARVPHQQLPERVRRRRREHLGHPTGQRYPERIAEAPGVLDAGPGLATADPRPEDPRGRLQPRQPARHDLLDRLPGSHPRPGHQLVESQRAQHPQQVGHLVGVTRPPRFGEMLQLVGGARQRGRVEQLPQRQPLRRAQQLGQQVGVERQRRRPLLGERGVPLVHELRDIAEQQRGRERRRRRRPHLDDAHLARPDPPHQLDQPGHIEHVLNALAHRLQHDRERRIARRHRQQLRRPLPLLPQGLTPIRTPLRQQQRPARALPEPRREQRRSTHLLGDERSDLLGVEQDHLQQITQPAGRPLAPRLTVALGVPTAQIRQPQDDAVVGVHRLNVDPVPLVHTRRDRQRPRRMHRRPVRRVDDDPPVAQLVGEPLDDQLGVVWEAPGRLPLLGQVGHEVVGRPRVQPRVGQPLTRSRRLQRPDLTDERPDRLAQLGRASERVALPEREASGLAGGRGDQHLVGGDVLDAPGRGAERDDVADPRLVDHLFVEFSDPPPRTLARDEHPEQPPVGDRAA